MAEAMITTEDDNSIVSENSFVILGQGSFPTDPNEGGTETINSPAFSLTNEENHENGSVNGDLGDNNSPLPDSGSIAIQIKLEKLVKENLLLKETLNQSNLAMKNQFDTLALWHEEVVKTHESHKQKFQETQDQIFKLRNENMNLKMLIQQSLETCNGNDSIYLNFDLEGIKELRLVNTELQKRLYGVVREKCDLEKRLHHALEENDNLKKEIEGLKTGASAECQDPRGPISNKAYNEYEDNEKSGEIMSLDPGSSIINKLSKSVEAELVLTATKRDFMELKKQFEEQSQIFLKNSEELDKMKELYVATAAKKDELNYLLEQSKIITRELTSKISSLNAELKGKDEQFKRKVDELEMIKSEMQEIAFDREEVAILKAQVELYQNDFVEERKAREQAISEKEKMAEQVRFLERTLSDFKKRDKETEKKVPTQTRILTPTPTPAPAPKVEKKSLSYMCPKCMKVMTNLRECESHVEACLESDMFP